MSAPTDVPVLDDDDVDPVGAWSGPVLGPPAEPAATVVPAGVLRRRLRLRRPWAEYPWFIADAVSLAIMSRGKRRNLADTYAPGERQVRRTEPLLSHRSYDGSGNDRDDAAMGSAGTRFGRNFPLALTRAESPSRLLTPNPRDVSRELLTRERFLAHPTLNMLAAAWLQFQVHGWVDHGDNRLDDPIDVGLRDDDPWPSCPMRVRRTRTDQTRTGDDSRPATYQNLTSHWWDGSQIYGADERKCRSLRTGEDGRLVVAAGRLPAESDPGLAGIDLTGFNDNYWAGLSMLHTLFAKEHNSICDRLRAAYPHWDDERLFHTARLVNTAVMARIHLLDWTAAILDCSSLRHGTRLLADGALPRWLAKRVRPGGRLSRSVPLTGAYGSAVDHSGVPFSITEEFALGYRLHPLVRDEYPMRRHTDGAAMGDVPFEEIQGHRTRSFLDDYGMDDALFSFATAHCGDPSLFNHPRALTDLLRLDGERVDLGTIDVLRGRERGVPRYNDFRELFGMRRLTGFDGISTRPDWDRKIAEVYDGRIDDVDTTVGFLAEPRPRGFILSDTGFRLFDLMSLRRVISDRFLTEDFTPEGYTPEGMEWVERTGMIQVLRRHHPELAPALAGVSNPFFAWDLRR